MQKIVIDYGVSGDWGASHDIVRCCEYESDTAFLIDFEEKLKKTIEEQNAQERPWFINKEFKIGGLTFQLDDFYSRKQGYHLPEVRALEDWFQNKVSDMDNY